MNNLLHLKCQHIVLSCTLTVGRGLEFARVLEVARGLELALGAMRGLVLFGLPKRFESAAFASACLLVSDSWPSTREIIRLGWESLFVQLR